MSEDVHACPRRSIGLHQGAMVAASAFMLVLSGTTIADEIKLTGGDQISGRIVERTDTHVVVKHRVLGELTIPLAQVDSKSARTAG